MNPVIVAIIVEFALLSLYVASHFIISRFIKPKKRWQTMKQLLLPGVCLAALSGYLSSTLVGGKVPQAWGLLACVIIVGLIHIGYLTVYAVFDRSISLRILIEIDQAGEPLKFEQIKNLYDVEAAFERRLQILEENGFLQAESEDFVLTKKGQKTGRLITALKSSYRFGAGG